jgi:hypothetical protein
LDDLSLRESRRGYADRLEVMVEISHARVEI